MFSAPIRGSRDVNVLFSEITDFRIVCKRQINCPTFGSPAGIQRQCEQRESR
jgi:hypothetical protein